MSKLDVMLDALEAQGIPRNTIDGSGNAFVRYFKDGDLFVAMPTADSSRMFVRFEKPDGQPVSTSKFWLSPEWARAFGAFVLAWAMREEERLEKVKTE